MLRVKSRNFNLGEMLREALSALYKTCQFLRTIISAFSISDIIILMFVIDANLDTKVLTAASAELQMIVLRSMHIAKKDLDAYANMVGLVIKTCQFLRTIISAFSISDIIILMFVIDANLDTKVLTAASAELQMIVLRSMHIAKKDLDAYANMVGLVINAKYVSTLF